MSSASAVPLSTADSFTPRELAAWRGLLAIHAHVLRQLDLQMRAAHGLTLAQSEVLIFLDDAPDQRMRMAELAKEALLSSSGGTRLVERLETLGYVTRRAATDDRRGLYAQLTDAGRHVVKAARATYQEGVRTTFLDQLRAADQVALSVISTRVRRDRFDQPTSEERMIQMSTHRALAERFAQTLTDHDLDAFGELLDEQYVNHNRFAPPGKDGSVAVFADFFAAFEDFRAEVDDIVEDGDTLVGRYTYRGRHTGTFMGVPPSGAQVELHSIDIWRVRDGRLQEHWDELNTLEFFQQIGAVPALN